MADWNLQREICLKISDMCLTNSDILSVMEGSASSRQINSSLCRLVTHGLVERIEKGCYQLTAKGFEALASDNFYAEHNTAPRHSYRPKRRTIRDKLWQAMRMLEKFTANDLVIRSEAKEDNAKSYIEKLRKAGHIVILRKAGGVNLYKLVKSTGDKTPFYSPKHEAVIDPNTNEKWEV